MSTADRAPNRRDILAASTALVTLAGVGADSSFQMAQAQQQTRPVPSGPPNIRRVMAFHIGWLTRSTA